MSTIKIPMWTLFRIGYIDGKEVFLTREQVEGSRLVTRGSDGKPRYRLYRVECSCGFIGRTRLFSEACQEMVIHSSETQHVMISLRGGVFTKDKLGEKNT